MNSNPNAIRILCYGDSNTYGRDALKKSQGIKDRYPADIRWPGKLQILLGNSFEVIEEGLGGRTTDLDSGGSSEKNGMMYLPACLNSHMPLDIIILMLGTNDLKEEYQRTPRDIAEADRRLIKVIRKISPKSKIILVSPTQVDETNPVIAHKYKGATEKSKKLAEALEIIAQEEKTSFVDLSKTVSYSEHDGVHLNQEDQEKIATMLKERIVELCQ